MPWTRKKRVRAMAREATRAQLASDKLRTDYYRSLYSIQDAVNGRIVLEGLRKWAEQPNTFPVPPPPGKDREVPAFVYEGTQIPAGADPETLQRLIEAKTKEEDHFGSEADRVRDAAVAEARRALTLDNQLPEVGKENPAIDAHVEGLIGRKKSATHVFTEIASLHGKADITLDRLTYLRQQVEGTMARRTEEIDIGGVRADVDRAILDRLLESNQRFADALEEHRGAETTNSERLSRKIERLGPAGAPVAGMLERPAAQARER